MPRADEKQRPFLPPPPVPAKPSLAGALAKPGAVKSAKGKRLTLPLEDQLVLAGLRDLLVGDVDSRLERIAVALERMANAMKKDGTTMDWRDRKGFGVERDFRPPSPPDDGIPF